MKCAVDGQEDLSKEDAMVKVKTFTSQIKVFHIMNELGELDQTVNAFIEETKPAKVISLSDTCTAGEGNTIGIVRVLAYEET
jgi:hypothetical protein